MEENKKPKNVLWTGLTLDIYAEAMELGIKNGVKPGESFEKELLEVMKKHGIKPVPITGTNKTKDQILGDLREKGMRVFDPHEFDRRRKEDDN